MPTPSRCGKFLDACTCQRTSPAARTPAEMEARHREAVKRAERSGWPVRTLAEIQAGRVAAPRRRAA